MPPPAAGGGRGVRADRLDLAVCPGITVVPPGSLRPSGGSDHYRVFTQYVPPGRTRAGAPWLRRQTKMPYPPGSRPATCRGPARCRGRARPARPGNSRAGSQRGDDGRMTGWPRTPAGTPRSATIWPPARPRCCPPTSTSAACPRWRWPSRPARDRSAASWPGGTSTTTHRRLPGHHHRRLPAGPPELAGRSRGARRLAARADRRTDRGRRHASAAAGRMDAQPGPDDHCLVPMPVARHRLAARRRALHGLAHRR